MRWVWPKLSVTEILFLPKTDDSQNFVYNNINISYFYAKSIIIVFQFTVASLIY